MGAQPYCYVIDYEPDPASALQKLRLRVFQEGAFWGSEKRPRTPEHALKAAGESGTQSILDITSISQEPDYCCAAPLTSDEVDRYFGTATPDADAVEACDTLWEDLERGQARFYVAYANGTPASYVFFGYSFD